MLHLVFIEERITLQHLNDVQGSTCLQGWSQKVQCKHTSTIISFDAQGSTVVVHPCVYCTEMREMLACKCCYMSISNGCTMYIQCILYIYNIAKDTRFSQDGLM